MCGVLLYGQNTTVAIKWQIINSYIRHGKVIKRGASNIYNKNLIGIFIYILIKVWSSWLIEWMIAWGGAYESLIRNDYSNL